MATFLLVMLCMALATAAPDWTDCPTPCRCKWSSGKKTAICRQAGFIGIPGTFDAEMQVLDLSGNSIPQLPRAAFRSVGLINLQKIYLSNAGLNEIHEDAFKDLFILVEVDLSNNKITSIHPDTFRGNERLRVIFLSQNPLRQLTPSQFPYLPHLRTLELNSCQLESIHRDAFIHLPALEMLNLEHNLLPSLSEAAFMNFAHLKTLTLEGNPWRCDCELRGFRDWFLASKLHSVSLNCAKPEALSDRAWEEVPSGEFACPPRVVAYPQLQVQVEAGDNVSVGCHVYGDPEPEVSWLYNGYPINHTWLVMEAEEGLLDKWTNLSIYNVSDVDVGLYTCVAGNILDIAAVNISLVLPEVVTATTLSKSDSPMVRWGLVIVSVALAVTVVIVVCYVRSKHSNQRREIKTSVSFTDQEKKLLDVSIATTTERDTVSCEALGSDFELMDSSIHMTIERKSLPLTVFPPPAQFSGGNLPATACPDLLDLIHRPKPTYHGIATLPRPQASPLQYDNMGPRVTAGGSSTLSLPDATAPVLTENIPPPPPCFQLTHEFVSL